MPRKKTVKSLKREAWQLFSKYIRLRDCLKTTESSEWAECISCEATKPFDELDAGHFVPKHNNNYFSERGVHAQCQSCNRFHGGNPLGYRRGLIELYGEEVTNELEFENVPIKKFTIPELEDLQEELKEKIRIMEG